MPSSRGPTYKALGSRITYAQAKDVLILEGDGRSPAELFQQKQAGAAAKRFTAQKILYWRKTKDIEGHRSANAGSPTPRREEKIARRSSVIESMDEG